jgi:GT2 family glycosyltransferase
MRGPDTTPRIRVVVVNYRRADLTGACVESLLRTEWPSDALEVVVVDNGSDDGSAARLRTRFPQVRVVESPRNLGFGGGNNLALGDLEGVEHVALVNNDATVDPGWLAPLVDALGADPGLGAACPRILFAGRFRSLVLRSRRGAVVPMVVGVEVDGADVWSRVQWVEGFGDPRLDPPHSRSFPDTAELRVPDGAAVRLELRGAPGGRVEIHSGDDRCTVDFAAIDATAELGLCAEPVAVIDNLGNAIDRHGFVADVGFLEVDSGAPRAPADVFAWCGAAVLLRGAYLREVGVFDERFFMYYEDVELSWRGRSAGYRYVTVPASVVHHVHAATSDASSATFAHLNERNRLLVLVRHAPFALLARGVLFHFRITASYLVRGLRSRGPRRADVRGRCFATARARTAAFAAFARRAPGMLLSRVRRERGERGEAPR